MKIRGLAIAVSLAVVLLFGSVAGAATVVTIGATPVPHAEILEFVKPVLAKEGIELRIVEFNDYVLPNLALSDGDLDANFFQHIPYLESFSADHRLDLEVLVAVHIEPIGVYSDKVTKLDELGNRATIAIPNDATNGGRALLLLETEGLITLADGAGITATVFDVVASPRNIRLEELEAPMLPRVLSDVDAAIINTNWALEAGLSPLEDAIAIEGKDSPYANVVVVRKGDSANPALQRVAEVLTSPAVRDFILEKYAGAVVPVF